MPWVTVGVPAARPSALPIATTASPTWSCLELPNTTLGNLAPPLICRSATSSVGSVPRSVADRGWLVPVRVTVITPPCWAAAMTWLLVTTRPSCVMIIPVPWSEPNPESTWIETTAGETARTSRGIEDPVERSCAPGSFEPWRIVTVAPCCAGVRVIRPPTTPPRTAATVATSRIVGHCERCRGGSRTSAGGAMFCGAGTGHSTGRGLLAVEATGRTGSGVRCQNGASPTFVPSDGSASGS